MSCNLDPTRSLSFSSIYSTLLFTYSIKCFIYVHLYHQFNPAWNIWVFASLRTSLSSQHFNILQESQRRGFCSRHLSLKSKPGHNESTSSASPSTGRVHKENTFWACGRQRNETLYRVRSLNGLVIFIARRFGRSSGRFGNIPTFLRLSYAISTRCDLSLTTVVFSSLSKPWFSPFAPTDSEEEREWFCRRSVDLIALPRCSPISSRCLQPDDFFNDAPQDDSVPSLPTSLPWWSPTRLVWAAIQRECGLFITLLVFWSLSLCSCCNNRLCSCSSNNNSR